jgi:hypothetical protein
VKKSGHTRTDVLHRDGLLDGPQAFFIALAVMGAAGFVTMLGWLILFGGLLSQQRAGHSNNPPGGDRGGADGGRLVSPGFAAPIRRQAE